MDGNFEKGVALIKRCYLDAVFRIPLLSTFTFSTPLTFIRFSTVMTPIQEIFCYAVFFGGVMINSPKWVLSLHLFLSRSDENVLKYPIVFFIVEINRDRPPNRQTDKQIFSYFWFCCFSCCLILSKQDGVKRYKQLS